jgi:pyridinium-3,5-biscarboxylic acid mononucleotide synthase
MERSKIEALLGQVAQGTLTPDLALEALIRLPFSEAGDALIDHHRVIRQRFPEAIYGPGKPDAQVAAIVDDMLTRSSAPVILTRANERQVEAMESSAANHEVDVTVSATGSTYTAVARPAKDQGRRVLLITAGSADWFVGAEVEAVLTALGLAPTVLQDRGVAGLQRLLSETDLLATTEGTVVVAGMEGALASVVGGLVAGPIVAVPTSTGYGASLDGVTALLGMLASCAAGVSVVGIDNGFGAAMALQRALGATS